MAPQFPLDPRNPPTCRRCGKHCTRLIVTPRNPIGHLDRPYYSCNDGQERTFSTWDDYEGITHGNPPCRCGFTSRRDTNRKGEDFFACPNRFNGGCGWSMTCNDQLTIVPRPNNSIPVAGTVPRYGAQQHPLYGAQFNAQYGTQYNSQYGSQNGHEQFPQHFPQQFPQHIPPPVPPQFPRQFPPQSPQDIPQYRDSRPWPAHRFQFTSMVVHVAC
jgi:hypothetical protein